MASQIEDFICKELPRPQPPCFKPRPIDENNPSCDGSMQFSISSFPKEAMEVMYMMKFHRKLCDVEIRVANEIFHAHKIVLAAASPYFKAMFTSGLKESEMSVINIQGVCPNSMAVIIRFAYTGEIKVEEMTVCNLLPAATMFQMNHIIEACCNFLEGQLDPTNCIGIADFALQHGCTSLYQRANQFMDQHFSQVSQGEEFLALSACQLVQLIKRDDLNVRCESEVFNAVLRWVKHDEERRRPKTADILYAVRCHFLTPRFLKEQIQECDLVKNLPQCCEYLSRIIQDLTVCRKYNCHQRTPKVPCVIYTAGGYLQQSLSNMECYNAHEQQWFSLADLPSPRSGIGGAFVDGKFYAVGGRNNSPDGNHDSEAADCFDPITNTWKPARPMNVARNRVGVAVLDGMLYAVGGSQGTIHHNSVERYDPVEDKWSFVSSMITARIGVGVAVVKRLLYAVGGYDGHARLNTVECYNPETDEWTMVASMNTTRSGAGVVALNNYIYAVGGYDGTSQLRSVERYNTETNEWECSSSMKSPRSALSAAVLDGKIYALGGYDGLNFLATMEVYDPQKDEWADAASMSCGRSGHASAVCRAPCLAHGVGIS
ncbi:kelch-like ECH-associated protein 1 isoform X2 [Limulus polyphemus]|nr:kelch-like ECH-associated protein 1 isoform X2 [Limulus polyphemus]XP_013773778.1 kelch-like ECH-associated protein 1 isoform X2 [Limulus polyphemus]XP_022240809.1 kelch-like ECH-associated protein 1 isoform X2 [Limulus polyphemus]